MAADETQNESSAPVDGPVVVVTGPTASGKTELAIALAERFDGEIVNADSMQVYRYMDIGTAKPSLEERGRVPHHLFDIVTPDADYNAGRYGQDARRVAREIQARGKLVVLCGGTGLYIRAFLEGLVGAGGAQEELREALEAEHAKAVAADDPERLHRRLTELDPAAAEKIHPNDLRRTIRALEIIETAGHPASRVREGHGFQDRPFPSLHLAIDPGRDVVAERINVRCQAMIDAGLLREVRGLRERGYGAELRPMQAIGYRHINPVVDGLDILTNAVEAMQVDTRRFARRQRTWLRKVESVVWMDPREEDEVLRAVDIFLANEAS
jgi:tRNA dimethylallyltransferase